MPKSASKSGKTISAAEVWRYPAEWEASDAVILAWPHPSTDWEPWLEDTERCFVALSLAILQRAKLLVLVKNAKLQARVVRLLDGIETVAAGRLKFLSFDYDDTWLRDIGPITLQSGDQLRWLDFHSTGYGGKYSASKDDKLIAFLVAQPEFKHCQHQRHSFALEGGGIESDGAGTVLSTWTCMSRRHPGKSQAEVANIMTQTLASQRILWLESGELEGDDTDAHIDTLARFADASTIVYQGCDDANDPHFCGLQAMAAELKALQTQAGKPYSLFELPWAGEILSSDGRRLAATYANFLILNGAILMPVYAIEQDVTASAVLAQAFPNHEIVGVDCRVLIEQNGSLHCLTMQLPQGCWVDV